MKCFCFICLHFAQTHSDSLDFNCPHFTSSSLLRLRVHLRFCLHFHFWPIYRPFLDFLTVSCFSLTELGSDSSIKQHKLTQKQDFLVSIKVTLNVRLFWLKIIASQLLSFSCSSPNCGGPLTLPYFCQVLNWNIIRLHLESADSALTCCTLIGSQLLSELWLADGPWHLSCVNGLSALAPPPLSWQVTLT